jgi:predicted amino acid-binding ACT domain protein
MTSAVGTVFVFAMALLVSCKDTPPPVIIQNPLTLQEIAPLPRQIVVQQAAVVEFEPVYAVFRIIEVAEVNGVQRNFLVRISGDRTGITAGVTGDIAEDAAFERIIGTYRIAEVFSDFFRCDIQELAYRIGTTAYIRVQTGEKLKETAAP